MELISAGADISGGLAEVAIGLFLAGSAGAITGGAGGPLITNTIKLLAKEIKQRYIDKREEARIGATIAYALVEIENNIRNGRQIRNDGFFASQEGNRSTADGVYEGVLLAAQREYEEKKLKYYGELLANIAFDESIDKGQANYLLRIAQNLSYRQMW